MPDNVIIIGDKELSVYGTIAVRMLKHNDNIIIRSSRHNIEKANELCSIFKWCTSEDIKRKEMIFTKEYEGKVKETTVIQIQLDKLPCLKALSNGAKK